MGIETSAEHDGSEMSFMAAIIVVEGTSSITASLPPSSLSFADAYRSTRHARTRKGGPFHLRHV
jgi:hypothetical protein